MAPLRLAEQAIAQRFLLGLGGTPLEGTALQGV
jgi:hypothetical protein